jgi:hypothetical protein
VKHPKKDFIMKKMLSLSLLSLIAAGSSLSAAYQYGDYVSFNFNNNRSELLQVTSDTNLTLNFFSQPWDQNNKVTNWETLTVRNQTASGSVVDTNIGITGTSINIGDFMTGDRLFFYVSGSQGTTLTSPNIHLHGQSWDMSTKSPDWMVMDGNYGQYNSKYTQLAFRIDGTAASGGSAPAPSGQPLPGVALSMLLGGFGLYIIKRRKAKSL